MSKLKIVAISDLHGYLPEISQEANIMIIAGDISPLNIQFDKPKMKIWLEIEFAYWIKSLPVDKVYLVAGNHDAYFQGINQIQLATFKQQCDFKLVYLENNYVVHRHDGDEFKIFGTPYCHIFGNWPFMVSDNYMEEKFKGIPDEVDIIISHDPPYGVGEVDCVLESTRWNNDPTQHKGNIPLRKRLEKIKYGWLFCGHLHSGRHSFESFNGGQCVNVSLKDENYQPVYKPYYCTLEK